MNQLYALRSEINALIASYMAQYISGVDGWKIAPELTYSSTDAPSFVVTCAGDYSSVLGPGTRIKLTHSGSTKFFIVTKSTYSAPTSTITLYGGTDYTLASGAITAPYYSAAKAPTGFPTDPDKWTITLTDANDHTQNNPTSGITYNLGGVNIPVPIGSWQLVATVYASVILPGEYDGALDLSLSTINNGISDNRLRYQLYIQPMTKLSIVTEFGGRITVTSKTPYYLNTTIWATAPSITSIANCSGGSVPTVLKAVCAFL